MVAFRGSSKVGLPAAPGVGVGRWSGEGGHRVVVLSVSVLRAVTFGLSNLLLLRGKVGQIFWLKVTTFSYPLGQQFAEGWGASSEVY